MKTVIDATSSKMARRVIYITNLFRHLAAVLHKKSGLLVDPTTVSDFAGTMIRLLCNPETAVSMGFEGQRWVREAFTVPAARLNLAKMLSPYLRES